MPAIGIFVAATVVVAAVTVVTVGLLWPPLRPLLAELCGGRARGDAWATLISVCAVLGATAASTLPDASLRRAAVAPGVVAVAPQSVGDGGNVLLGAAAQGALGLAGVLLSLFVTAGALFVYIKRTNACEVPTALAGGQEST